MSGCGTEGTSPPATPTTSHTAELAIDEISPTTRRWIPNPSVDLMSPEGTFIRAAYESEGRSAFGRGRGIDAIEDAGYPGFLDAFNNVEDPDEVGGTADKTLTWAGTSYSEVVSLRRDGSTYTAKICGYSNMTAFKEAGTSDFISAGTSPAWSASLMTFGPNPRLPAAEQHAPPANQKGPARTPSTNVFGTWVLLKRESASVGEPPTCTKIAPGTPPTWPRDKYIRPEPPPTLPPDPGWPVGGAT